MSNQSNSAPDKAAALDEAEQFGQREGSGSAARAGFYYQLTEFSMDKRLDVADAPDVWDRFHKGAAKGAAMIGGVKVSNNPEDTRKVRISECRQFLKLGGLAQVNGVEVLSRAMGIIKTAKLEGRLKSKATDAMINVARAQCEDPQNALEDETIEDKIQPKVGADKVEADALEAVAVRLGQIAKKFEGSDEVSEAIRQIETRIQTLGGTTRAQRAKAKAKKKKK